MNQHIKKQGPPDHLGNSWQMGGAQKLLLEEGKGKGTSLIRVRNGRGLDFTILPDKGMDIFDINFQGVQLAWISRNGIVANSLFDDREMGWLRSFGGGMLTTCGLRNVGPPQEDDGEHYGLHGRISGTPARNVTINEYWDNGLFYIEISGEVNETRVFGENLCLNRVYRVNSGSDTIELRDSITNLGKERQQLMLLYHMNWGYPLLSPGSSLSLEHNKVLLRGEDQSEVNQWGDFLDPISGYNERVYFFNLHPDKNDQVYYQLSNDKIRKAVRVSWKKEQLPVLAEWKMMGEGEYVLGLEPANARPIGRKEVRSLGDAEFLDASYTKEVSLDIQFLNTG